ncbi:MAG: ATP-binding protein, partial [Acidimicrobiales bacterium]
MSLNLDQSTGECCVVIGPDNVSNCRAHCADVPIVALVDATSPERAVLAQAAGADVVLPVPDLDVALYGDIPGLALAVSAAGAIANRRREVVRSSRQVSHDLAGAFNVIGLAAEVATSGAVEPDAAFTQIAALAKAAGSDAWRAGRANRSLQRSLAAVDVSRVVRGASAAGDDVEVITPPGELWAFADEQQLTTAVHELIGNARTAGATRIVVQVGAESHTGDHHDGDNRTVNIAVSDDGSGFATEQRDAVGQPHNTSAPAGRLGLGLATIAEFVADSSGSFAVSHGADSVRSSNAHSTTARLTFPAVSGCSGEVGPGAREVDHATAQADILEGVVRHAPLAESLDAIVTAIENQLPGTTCSVLLLNDGSSLHHGAGAKLPVAYRQAIDGVAIGRGQGSCGTAAFVGRPVVATDVTTDENWVDFRDVATEHGLRSCWSTPIVAAEGGEVLGTFAVYKASVWRPDEAATKLVQRFTYLAAVAIEHHRLFEAVAESESRFRSAFEGASAGLALVRLDGTLLKVNPSLSTMVARPEADLVSSNLLDLVDPDWREEIRTAWDLLAQGQVAGPNPQPTIEVPLATSPNGEQVWVSLSTSIIAAAGEWNFYVEVRDITVSRRHLAEQRAREAAEAANRAKNDFLALVSHELRTPLNAILGFAQVMQLADLDLDDAQRADGVQQIVRAGEHLRDLIDQLLDLSRIEAGQLSVQTEHVDTAKVIHEAIDLVGPLAMSRNISLANDRCGADRHHVVADRRCLRQVLINLLGNAVKYTPAEGQVSVEVNEVAGGHIRITVNDTGPGIAPESIDELFRPFHRLEQDNDARSEGTGLGLALTERLMVEMGGAIGVDSTVGVGSS